ncbi:MAG: PEP-CTERM sorting domain-containing protein [Candidatus Spyradosoma sp.]
MKNIIAITSLLAAGTALANATVLSFSENASGTTCVSIDLDSTSVTTIVGSADFLGEYSGHLDIYRISGGKHWLGDVSNSATWSNESAFSILENQTGLSSDSVKALDKYLYPGWADGGIDLRLSRLTAGQTYTVTLLVGTVLTGSSASGLTSQLSLTKGSFINGVSASLTGEGSAEMSLSGTNLASRTSSSLYDVYSMNIAADTNGEIQLKLPSAKGDDGKSSMKQALLLMSIPEPSAFGLLAGLGALALAAARRRRSRK